MRMVGQYCKAFHLSKFRQFEGWQEKSSNVRKENDVPRPLTDADSLFLQENFVVTDGIFMDENVIFDNITPEWTSFCINELQFVCPNHVMVEGEGNPNPD